MLALYHGAVTTQEVTFLTPIPGQKITGWKRKHDTSYQADFSQSGVDKILGPAATQGPIAKKL